MSLWPTLSLDVQKREMEMILLFIVRSRVFFCCTFIGTHLKISVAVHRKDIKLWLWRVNLKKKMGSLGNHILSAKSTKIKVKLTINRRFKMCSEKKIVTEWEESRFFGWLSKKIDLWCLQFVLVVSIFILLTMYPMCCVHNCPLPSTSNETPTNGLLNHHSILSSRRSHKKQKTLFLMKDKHKHHFIHTSQPINQPMCYVSSILHKSKEHFKIFALSTLRVHAQVWLCNIVRVLWEFKYACTVFVYANCWMHASSNTTKVKKIIRNANGQQCKHTWMGVLIWLECWTNRMFICIRIRFNRLLLFLCDELSNGSVSSNGSSSSNNQQQWQW